jgi:uncharacterized protein
MILGLVSDTHGKLHPRAAAVLREAGVELILHAGDVGEGDALEQLGAIAPVQAVRGNVDTRGESARLPEEVALEVEGIRVYMTHIGGKPRLWLPRLPQPRPVVAICGHSHVALVERLEGVLFVNPGSAGTKPRFGGGLSLALLRVSGGHVEAEIVTL